MAFTYYNEIDPFAVRWLKKLIEAEVLPDGFIDSRPIQEVRAADLKPFTQCHFFAGIGGWPYALQLADVPVDMPIWTGSCPCQPFSSAGNKKGFIDNRHLWPYWENLIGQCKPSIIFGEQVTSKLGRAWLSAVQADLEKMDYVTAAADLCAAGVGAPHSRQRLYFVGMGDTIGARLSIRKGVGKNHAENRIASARKTAVAAGSMGLRTETGRLWNGVYAPCTDGKYRLVNPGIRMLANGLPGRVGRIRGFGNAIVPQVAAVFVTSAFEALNDA